MIVPLAGGPTVAQLLCALLMRAKILQPVEPGRELSSRATGPRPTAYVRMPSTTPHTHTPQLSVAPTATRGRYPHPPGWPAHGRRASAPSLASALMALLQPSPVLMEPWRRLRASSMAAPPSRPTHLPTCRG